jgi:thymidine phosphorylase
MKFVLQRIGIDTHKESVAFLDDDDLICHSVEFQPMDRIEISGDGQRVLCVLNAVEAEVVPRGAIGLSNYAFAKLGLPEGTEVDVRPAEPPASTDLLRARMAGKRFSPEDIRKIVHDIVEGRYSKIELTAFVVAATINALDDDEVYALATATVESGERLQFKNSVIADKHCIGGVPGNRTTPIVVAIAAAAGLVIPKTSSRAVTSPAGTADTMETLMNVELPLERIYEVVGKESGCLVWGGALNLAPPDDLIIRVEHPLHIDSESFMIASILSKKSAAGATHLVLDIPVGRGGKAETPQKAEHLQERFENLATRLNLRIKTIFTDGTQPVGRGIGPVLEAQDVLAVLSNDPNAPLDLREKSLHLAGALLELTGALPQDQGRARAEALLRSGAAFEKFERIRALQGYRQLSAPGRYCEEIRATKGGRVQAIHNRLIARIAKLAGAPRDAGAGVFLHKHVGDFVQQGEPLFRVHAHSAETLGFALRFWEEHLDILEIR